MRTYRRIQYEDRCQIYAFWKAGTTEADIGNALGFSQGTVSRELFRNKGGVPLSAISAQGAGPAQAAHADAQERTKRSPISKTPVKRHSPASTRHAPHKTAGGMTTSPCSLYTHLTESHLGCLR